MFGHLRHCFAYKLHQNAFGGRAPSEPTEGGYSAPQIPIAGFRSQLLRKDGEGGRAVKEKEKRGREWRGVCVCPRF